MSAETARRILDELGPEALVSVELCIEECRRLNDDKGARYWSEVAARLPSTPVANANEPDDQAGGAKDDLYFRRRRWLLMQKIEMYRRRAIRAEAEAGGSDAHRGEMLDLAMQWFELARQYEWLAADLEKGQLVSR